MEENVENIINELIKFRDDKSWQRFHSLINLSRALEIEASEVNKVFLWKNNDDDLSEKDKDDLKLEIADVLIYSFYMCEKLKVDPLKIMDKKININKNRSWCFDEEK